MKRRPLVIAAAILVATTVLAAGAEMVARSSVNSRLAEADSPFPLRFTGASALLSAATSHAEVTASMSADDIASLLATKLPDAGSVELTDDAVGIHLALGQQDAIAWLSLTPSDDGITLDIETIEVAGFSLDPSLIAGEGNTSVTLSDPVSACAGASVEDIRITPSEVDVTVATDRSALSCLNQAA